MTDIDEASVLSVSIEKKITTEQGSIIMGEIVSIFERRAAIAVNPAPPQSNDWFAPCEAAMDEARQLLATLVHDRPDDARFLGGSVDNHGWGVKYLSRLYHSWESYGGYDIGEIAMACGAYVCEQRLRRLEQAIHTVQRDGEKPDPAWFRLKNESKLLDNARSNPRQATVLYQALAKTERAIKLFIAPDSAPMRPLWRGPQV